MELIAIWFISSVVAMAIASSKKLGCGWASLGFIFGPIGILMVLLVPSLPMSQSYDSSRVKCPFCAELIQPEAIVCRWCGRDIQQSQTTSQDVRLPSEVIQNNVEHAKPEEPKELKGDKINADRYWIPAVFISVVILLFLAVAIGTTNNRNKRTPKAPDTVNNDSASKKKAVTSKQPHEPMYGVIDKLETSKDLVLYIEVPINSQPSRIKNYVKMIKKEYGARKPVRMINFYVGGRGADNMVATYQGSTIYIFDASGNMITTLSE